jgi:hypothetical protein
MTATAYHEAGHAIICERLGIRVKHVTIIPDDGSSGRCTHEKIISRRELEFDSSDGRGLRIEKIIMICLAGLIAQRISHPRSVRNYHASSDYRQAADLALSCTGSVRQAEAHLKWLSIRTEDLVKLSWSAVEALVADLSVHGTLTYTTKSRLQIDVRRSTLESDATT